MFKINESIDRLDLEVELNYLNNGLYDEEDDYYSQDEDYDYTCNLRQFKNTFHGYSYDYDIAEINLVDGKKEHTLTACRPSLIYFLNIEGVDYIYTPTGIYTFKEGYNDPYNLQFEDLEGSIYNVNFCNYC